MLIGVPVKCQNGHKAVWKIKINGINIEKQGVDQSDKCGCPKWDFGQGYSANGAAFIISPEELGDPENSAEKTQPGGETNKTHDAISLMDKLYHRYHKMIGCDMLYSDFEHALVEWQKQHHA